MARKFYKLDDLYNFCRDNRFESFSSEKQGAPLIVQSFGTFEADDKNADGLMSVKLKSCHTGKNRNKSGITDDNMNKYKHTFKGRPILGAIYKTDTGEYEFRAHDMKVIDDGEDIEYIEQPIGVISQTEDPYLEFDEEEDKNYLMVSGTIFSDYSKAADILERRRTCKCSVEIAVEELSYNCDEDYLSIDKFRFSGVTILGYEQDGVTEIQEGMKGSKITIDDFSEKKNSMFSADCQEKMIEVLEKLNNTLSNFNTNIQKGGNVEMNTFEILLEKYGKTAEDVTFDIEGLSDEELEAKFKEAFEDSNGDNGTDDGTENNTSDEGSDGEDNGQSEDGDGTSTDDANGTDGEPEKFTKTFTVELSHDDIRNALYTLIRQYENDDEWLYVREVFDSYFVMQDWWNNKIYKQNYSVDGENVSLDGDRIEVYEILVTKEEKDALDALKENYSALEARYNELKAFKETYDASVIKAQKTEILDKVEYECLVDNAEFVQLRTDMDNFSVEEISTKADLIFAAHMKSKMEFSANDEGKKKPVVIGFSVETKKEKKKAYGNLFKD